MSDTPQVEKFLYSAKEAAYAIGVSRPRVYQLIKEGRIPAVNLGGRVLIRRDDLAAFVDALPSTVVVVKRNLSE